MEEINIYCDESCHLEHDQSRYMVIGCIYTEKQYVKSICKEIKRIKIKNGFTPDYEIKWTRTRKANVQLYKDCIDYFFQNDQLRLRIYIIDKKGLDHNRFFQNHDEWYYKMYFDAIEYITLRNGLCNYDVYIDVKDTHSGPRTKALTNILNNYLSRYGDMRINKTQVMQSHESQLMQICDLFIGATRYKKAGLSDSDNKKEIISYIEQYLRYGLDESTPLSDSKINRFNWRCR